MQRLEVCSSSCSPLHTASLHCRVLLRFTAHYHLHLFTVKKILYSHDKSPETGTQSSQIHMNEWKNASRLPSRTDFRNTWVSADTNLLFIDMTKCAGIETKSMLLKKRTSGSRSFHITNNLTMNTRGPEKSPKLALLSSGLREKVRETGLRKGLHIIRSVSETPRSHGRGKVTSVFLFIGDFCRSFAC